jgi:hypothetical protein
VSRSESTVCCWTTFSAVGSGIAGLNSRASRLVPFGVSVAVTSVCTPNASVRGPDMSLNFSASISENDSMSTKKHMSRTMRSANVVNHGGAPWLGTTSAACSRMDPSG